MGAGRSSPKVPLSPPLSLPALGLTVSSTLDEALQALVRMHKEIQGLQPNPAESTAGQSSAATGQARQRRGAASNSTAKTAAGADGKAEGKQDDAAGCAWASDELPSRDKLFILLDAGDGTEDKVLGNAFAMKNGQKRLSDLGVSAVELAAESGGDDAREAKEECAVHRLVLAASADALPSGSRAASAGAPRKKRQAICSHRTCYRCMRRGCTRCGSRVWAALPARWKEKAEPVFAQWRFYFMCAKLGFSFLWQDRHEMLRELRVAFLADLATPEGPPPCGATQVREELRPFGYALLVACTYALWDVSRQAIWAPRPPMNLTLT